MGRRLATCPARALSPGNCLLLFVRDEVRPVDAPAPSPSPARQHSSHRSWLCLASFAFTFALFGARVLACSGLIAA